VTAEYKSKIKRRVLIIHPFLIAVFPILSLYYHNIAEVGLSSVLLPLGVVFIVTPISLLVSNLVFRNWQKSAIFTTLLWLITFSHGHLHNLIASWFGNGYFSFGPATLGIDDFLFGTWLVLAVTGIYVLLRVQKNMEKFTMFINITSLFLVIPIIAGVVPREIEKFRTVLPDFTVGPTKEDPGGQDEKPDIYYIIPDRYAANSTLKDFYGYDNSYFTDFLKEKGFYVARDSVSNYPRTHLSLASSLNMMHLESVGTFREMIQNNALGRFLKGNGYRYLNVGSWYGLTSRNALADINFDAGGELNLGLDEFSLNLLENTALLPIMKKLSPGLNSYRSPVQQRNYAFYQFSRLKEISKTQSSPKFVFAHVLLPHDPYSFSPDCGEISLSEKEVENYLSQLSCTNRLLMEAVEDILENSTRPPIIIIQADEGPYEIKYSYLPNSGYLEVDPRALRERAQIFNSYYLPGVNPDDFLYPSITPVNSFRLILNIYFGQKLDLLPDRSYIFREQGELYRLPKAFIDVTELLGR